MPQSYEQETPGKFLPAFFVDVVDLGQKFESGELPLHMTYFPPVHATLQARHVDAMRYYMNPLAPLELHVNESDYFGENHDIHVKRVEKTPQLMVAHRAIVSAIGLLPHDRRFRMPFNPHITIPEGDTRVKTDDIIHVGGVAVVEKPAGAKVWTVMAKVGLKGDN